MSRFSEIDPELLNAVAAAVAMCWDEGSPVAGHSRDRCRQMAHVSVRRHRSFVRRKVSLANRDAQIRDIAEGYVAAFEDDPKLVGPLIIDYQYVAQRALEAIEKFNSGG